MFLFPRKTLLRYESRGVRRQRVASLQSLFTIIFQLLETYRDDYFLARNRSSHGCQMLSVIESFLGLTPEVSKLLHDGDVNRPLRLNLNGWRSDQKNLGACPFWTTYRTLKAFPFPRKTMFPCELRSVRRQRCVLLHSLFTTLFQLLEEFPDDCFQQSDECHALKSIEEFLGLNEDVQKKLRDEADGPPGRLNLRGWQSDRKNLYFQDEVRPSLLPSDDEEDEEGFDDHDVMLVPMNCYRRRCPST
ncbi:hypothetical protein Poli38472_008145 [Pythium oligandrum]|uniref:Uncharacterized protein n=1 Tax=Pythium oligandrum TaxID=41045 RepID=A0A8K1FPD3_PYTOL|nr:hypothetical protein Poli38472_008145 [Pythium oligandrum]|eukprot:TMW65503.1 hypothetical protein Poli38472_008145 [Pythium oligandrum]